MTAGFQTHFPSYQWGDFFTILSFYVGRSGSRFQKKLWPKSVRSTNLNEHVTRELTHIRPGKGNNIFKSALVGEESSQIETLIFEIFLIFNSSQDFEVSSRITAQLLEKPCRWQGMWALHRPQTLPGSHQWSGEQLNPHESRRWGRIRFNKIDPLWKWWYFFHRSLWPNFSELNVSGFAFKKPHRDRYMNIQPKRKLQ